MTLLRPIVKFLGRDSVTILLFHKVPKVQDALVPGEPTLAQFERALDFVMEHFQIVPVSDVVTGLFSGNLPKNAACLTFDDGYADWATGVAPVLLQRNMHASFFLSTDQFNGFPMWHERVNNVVRHCKTAVLKLPEIDVPFLPIGTLEEKRSAVAWLQKHLKHQSLERRAGMMQVLESAVDMDPLSLPRMSVDDLREIHSKGFTIGAHTVNHPILTHTTDAEAVYEIGGAREQLEALIRGPVDSFAYPNGRPTVDFLPRHIGMVKAAGYRYALTTQHGVVRPGCSPYQMPRFTPWGPNRFRMLSQVLRNQVGPKLILEET